MTASIVPPFPVFLDAAGDPIDGGFIYIGSPNLNAVTNPQTVYWDEALTIPASQPLRTSSGVIVRSGAPANVYIGGDYSIAVHDADNAQVFTFPTASGLPAIGGSITLASGESLTAQNGSDVILQDGAELTIGSNTGVGVLVNVAANARVVGSLIPNTTNAHDLGSASREWGTAHIDDVLCETLAFGNDVQPTGADLGSLNRRTMTLALARQTSSTSSAAFTNIYNIFDISRVAQGVYDVELKVPVDALANVTVFAQPHLNGVTSAWLDGSSTTSVFRLSFFDPAALAQIDTPFSLEIKGFIPG